VVLFSYFFIQIISSLILFKEGHTVAWLGQYATTRKIAGSILQWCHCISFRFTQSFQPYYGPEVDSASNRNEYQESSWGVKGGRRVWTRCLTTEWTSTASYSFILFSLFKIKAGLWDYLAVCVPGIIFLWCPFRKDKGKVIPVQAVEALRVAGGWGSHIFRHSAHRWRRGCQPYAPAAFYPHEDSW
jgi:hypothetical protein